MRRIVSLTLASAFSLVTTHAVAQTAKLEKTRIARFGIGAQFTPVSRSRGGPFAPDRKVQI